MENKNVYGTKICTCIDCGASFTVSDGELKSKEKNGMRPPKRCPDCRHMRRKYPDKYKTDFVKLFYSYPATAGHRHKVHGGRSY